MTQVAMTGSMFGPYRIDDRIGMGGMGVVYAATDTRLDRRVAPKLVSGQLAGAHRVGEIHRDVKPGNVLLRDPDAAELHAYLCDLGIAPEAVGLSDIAVSDLDGDGSDDLAWFVPPAPDDTGGTDALTIRGAFADGDGFTMDEIGTWSCSLSCDQGSLVGYYPEN